MQKTLGLSSLLCFSGYLVHIKIVPSLGEESDHMVTEFVDKIITCEKPTNNSESLELALLTLWILLDTWSRPYSPRLYGLLALLFSIECKLPPVWSIGDKHFYALFHGRVGIIVPLMVLSCVVI